MAKNAELENAKDDNSFEIRRLEAANATLKKTLDRALKSKTTAKESDWDILGLVEDGGQGLQ